MHSLDNIPEPTFIQTGSKQSPIENNTSGFITEKLIFHNELPKDDEIIDEKKEEICEVDKTQKKDYTIMSLFWLYNEKLFDKNSKFYENEAQFCTISYNCNFGNVRLDYYDIPQTAIKGHVVFLNLLNKKISGTIYPASLFKIKCLKIGAFTCMEQLVTHTGEEWQSQRPVCQIKKLENSILLGISDHTGLSSVYEFKDWQYHAFMHCVNFALNQGLQLFGQQLISK